MRRLAGLVLLGALFGVGCGERGAPAHLSELASEPEFRGGKKDEAKEAAGGERRPQEAEKAQPRKIIYNGQIELIVEDFDRAEEQMLELLKGHDGYVARSERRGRPGDPRSGTWTLRIPVAKFDDFRRAVAKVGELRRDALQSDDITDRYYDTKAEVTNLEAREKALRKLYDEKIAGSKLTDLLEVDRELSSVRGQINQRKGQIQRWDKETEFATLELRMQDRKGYVPPTSPDFGTSVSRTWAASIDGLVWTGKGIVLVAVAVAPWLVVFAVLFAPVVLVGARVLRRRLPPPVPVTTPTQPATGEPPAAT